MPLFVCDECGCVENTALSNYWLRHDPDPATRIDLCSGCDPKIEKWHGKFRQHEWDKKTPVLNREAPA